jgi:hypothetical protein
MCGCNKPVIQQLPQAHEYVYEVPAPPVEPPAPVEPTPAEQRNSTVLLPV